MKEFVVTDPKGFTSVIFADSIKVTDHGQLLFFKDGAVKTAYNDNAWAKVRTSA